MQRFDFLDKKRHGTAKFPVEYYYVDSNHPRYIMAFHWHNEWELLRIVKGELLLTLDDEQYRIKEGDIVLIPGETLHSGEPSDCIYECLVFDIYDLFGKTESVKSHLRPFYRMDLIPERFFTNNDSAPKHVLDIFSKMNTSACLELETLSALAGLFAWLINEKKYRQISDKSRWSSSIKPVLEYIEEHYSEELSLDILADVAGMNARYLCKIFQSLTHMTPINYVNFYRIEQAAVLLDYTDLPITDISQKCGFWESSYFTKVFKKFKNITPKLYRRLLRAEHTNEQI